MSKNLDVDLEAALADKSGEEDSLGASAEKDSPESDPSEKAAAEAEASERAQERIRTLVEEKKQLEEKLNVRDSSELDTFIASIQDEPSRNLLKTYGSLLEKRIQQEINPLKDEYSSAKFDKEFAQYADKIPELAAHKDELRKSFLRNPSQSVKSLVSETLLDIQTARIRPIESDSSAKLDREDKKDASAIEDKEELYALLDANKGAPVQ